MSLPLAASRRRPPRRLLLFLLLWPLAVLAEVAEQAHDAGVAAFEAGEYRLALERLLEARDSGLDTPVLYYNLGSAWYRLGNYAQSRAAFQIAMTSPELAPLAWYNLGLVATQLGETGEARDWFLRVLDGHDHAALRALATTMLDRLGGGEGAREPPADFAPAPAWQGLASGGIGHDDNVLLVSDDDLLGGSDRSDFFLDLYAQAWREIAGDAAGRRALEFDASAWLLRHARLDEFDMASLRGGATYDQAFDTWIASGGAHGAWSWLNGRGLTREFQISARAARPLSAGLFRARYELGLIEALRGEYGYLDGGRHRLDARLIRLEGDVRVQLHYQLEYNDREDLVAPRFTSASPVRNQLGMSAEIPLGDTLALHAEIQYMRSRYRDPNELADGDRRTRVDARLGAIGRLAWRVAGSGELSVEYRYTDNTSTIPVYAYTRHRITAGALLTF